MGLTPILILIFIGIILILIEILVLPGTNIAGIIGIAFILGAIFLSYKHLGTPIAHYVLMISFLLMSGAIFFVLRSNTWKKMSLNTSIDSKVETIEKDSIKIGDEGITVTRLAPIGKVQVNDRLVEAKSDRKFLDPDTPVKVVEVLRNQIIVELIDNK